MAQGYSMRIDRAISPRCPTALPPLSVISRAPLIPINGPHPGSSGGRGRPVLRSKRVCRGKKAVAAEGTRRFQAAIKPPVPPRSLGGLLVCLAFLNGKTTTCWSFFSGKGQEQHSNCRGRDADCPAPPSQIPAGGFPAPGSSSQLALACARGLACGSGDCELRCVQEPWPGMLPSNFGSPHGADICPRSSWASAIRCSGVAIPYGARREASCHDRSGSGVKARP